jgi:hypothetical protein
MIMNATLSTSLTLSVTVIAAILVMILISLIPVLALHLEIDHNRKVIGGNERLSAAMHYNPYDIQSPIKIDVIEVHQWKNTRISPGPSEERTDGNAIEMIFHQTRSQSRNPFIEIPQDNPRPGLAWRLQDS